MRLVPAVSRCFRREGIPPAHEVIGAIRTSLDELNQALGSRFTAEVAGESSGLLRVKVSEGGEPKFLVDFTRIAGHVGDCTSVVLQSALGPQAVLVPTDSGLLLLKVEALLFRRYLKAADVYDVWFLASRRVRLSRRQREQLSEEVLLREVELADVEARLRRLTPERFLADLRRRVSAEQFHFWNVARAQVAIQAVLILLRKEIRWP